MADPNQAPNEERLDALDDDIDRARRTAEDADIVADPDEPRFHETGDRSDIDDQTIAPPG